MNNNNPLPASGNHIYPPANQLIEQHANKIKVLLSHKKYSKAEKLIKKACKKWPSEIFFKLAKIEYLLNTKRVPLAVVNIEKLLISYPEDISVRTTAAVVYCHARDYKKAYLSTHELPDGIRKSKKIYDIISICLSKYQFEDYAEQFEIDILELIKNPDTGDHAGVTATTLIEHKYKLSQGPINIDLNKVHNDPLLHAVLTTTHIQSHHVEKFIRLSRKSILISALNIMEVPGKLLPLVTAICLQNFRNEYIHFVDSDEETNLQQLLTTITELKDNADWKIADIEGLLMLLGMYYKLHDLPIRDKLLSFPIEAWPKNLVPVAQATLFNIQQEIDWLSKVESLGSISNETSRKVQQQYEENPYPRWHRLFNMQNKHNYFRHIESQINQIKKTTFNYKNHAQKPHILIAGCGTGAHPLNIAVNSDCKITAIDISRRSIAYAMMMQDRHKINNIEFFQLDIIEIDKLNTTFDAAESCGVLHHMLKPEQGLEAIIKAVKPGGTIKLGLYSELARRDFVSIRNLYLETGMSPSESNIRELRHGILSSAELMKKYPALLTVGDFYSTSACRDLLFHEQEHRYTIPQLQAMLKKYNLKFLSFVFTNRTIDAEFIKLYGQNKLHDLNAWHDFEQKNPGIFISMYQFFVEKSS